MQDINLLEEMANAQIEFEQNNLVKEVQNILSKETAHEEEIEHRLKNASIASPIFSMKALVTNRIFNVEAIEKICTRYRLRFLSSELFKGDIPAEAIREVKRIETATGITFNAFRIVAPEERFNLKDSTKDPILLAELPDGRYYYIFQWGDDMKWYQELLKYPFRHIGALAATAALIGLLVALLVPSQFPALKGEFFFRFFMFSLTTCLVMTLSIIIGIMNSKDFSENVWNSKFNK
jgi:hypothetical protein